MRSWSAGYVADLGYTHGFYRELAPSYLAFNVLLKGLQPADINAPLNYCELGCGQGFSAAVLASTHPNISYYANDFNVEQIVNARFLSQQAGLSNLYLYDHSFEDFADEPSLPPKFDIISLHGIYSWVSAENRLHIVDFIRRKLQPGGIVYLSYNCLPGWAAAAPMRHLMFEYGRRLNVPTIGKLGPALEYLTRLANSDAGYFRANPLVKGRLEKLKSQPPAYLAHEYLNESWSLPYYPDVADELEAAKVTFIGSAHALDHVDALNVTSPQAEMLREISDPRLRELVRDYIINQQFRRDIFSSGSIKLTPSDARQRWLTQRFVLSVARGEAKLTVSGALEANLQSDFYTPIFDRLSVGPASLQDLIGANPDPATFSQWTQALTILVGSNQVQPCLPIEDETKRKDSSQRLNAVIAQRAAWSTDLQFFASPVTGSGVLVDRMAQLFAHAIFEGADDPLAFVTNVMREAGVKLLSDGKPVEDPELHRRELQSRYDLFLREQKPLLQRTGILQLD